MSLLVLSHLIQFAALLPVEALNVLYAAWLAVTVGLFDGATAGKTVFHDHVLTAFAYLPKHPGDVVYVAGWTAYAATWHGSRI
ncbi:hypothetical protein BBJ41_01190 [Burkholderia stabilis]|nr:MULTISPECIES: hypothetical protein [Burkholderia cepacia complex]AOR66280.1 hypothetical protein BBJ41_01190 [Burkholderia stabilis]MBR8042065.1 hypothetical protein [Burkholderia cenocepacia]HDR9491910.1 hypothetical protein [Burkholderia stabilis]HDR9524056.1 hypothetical protein [Burkholderia stabilis]HDR9530637.1 hypothetical protein [Burkholderia stabilis]